MLLRDWDLAEPLLFQHQIHKYNLQPEEVGQVKSEKKSVLHANPGLHGFDFQIHDS